MSIADNLRRVQERIARAAEAAGRRAHEVTLVGVTKYVGVREVLELLRAGCTELGESRPQELWAKHSQLAAGELASASGDLPPIPEIHWHLIGHLQRNKLRRTLPLVTLIHSVDNRRLLDAIDAERQSHAAAQNQQLSPIRILLEVNTSGEAAKHGLAPDEVEPLLAAAAGVSPRRDLWSDDDGRPGGRRRRRGPQFRHASALADRFELKERSMGMSGDFEVAIREGATIVRVGSALWE